MRPKIAILAAMLIGLHLVLLFAGFFAPYDPTTQDRDLPYAPHTIAFHRRFRISFASVCVWVVRCLG